jgi:hypothetical protein
MAELFMYYGKCLSGLEHDHGVCGVEQEGGTGR